MASPETFIADSLALAMVMVGWVYLLSSSFSFPELLVGFPKAHPSLLALFLMRVRRRSILRSSHGGRSANFALTEFSEVHLETV